MINKWNEKEDNILKKLYPTAPIKELEKKLPRRKITAIYARANVLKLKRLIKNISQTKGVRRRY